jgi:hypothetical protein
MKYRQLLSLNLVLGCLAAIPFFSWGQNQLTPYKVSFYEDGGRVSFKGLVAFDQQKAEMTWMYPASAENLDVQTAGPCKISYMRLRSDSAAKVRPVQSFLDVLKANPESKVSVVYQIGNEFDDIDGRLRSINESAGFVVIKGENGSDFYIPTKQIRQVVVSENSNLNHSFRDPIQVLELGIDADLPSSTIEIHSFQNSLKWTPKCQVKLLDSNKAKLQVQAAVDNQFADLQDVELEFNPGQAMTSGESLNLNALAGMKMSIKKGEQLLLNLQESEIEYESSMVGNLKWTGVVANSQPVEMPVERTLRLKLPQAPLTRAGQIKILDEHHRQMAKLSNVDLGTGNLWLVPLGLADGIDITLTESIVGKESKPVKVGGKSYEKVVVEGRLSCTNSGQQFAQLNLSRNLVGEILDGGKGTTQPTECRECHEGLKPYSLALGWKIGVDKGQKKELTFRYSTWLEIP